MNNQQFRRLIADKPGDGEQQTGKTTAHAALGTKRSGFVGMAPRNVKRSSETVFQQPAQDRPAKKFKSSAPKGSYIVKGYVDRAKARAEHEGVEDEKATRIKALEKRMKDGDIDTDTFERLREEITAGDVSNTHLIKGLDRRLLDRVRRGEDVLGLQKAPKLEEDVEVDEELGKLEDTEVQAIAKEKVEKRGQRSEGAQKRTRDEIMAELKAQRKAASEARVAAEPALDSRWRRTDEKTTSRIEIDNKGREVLITVDEDGVVKKRVRKAPKEEAAEVKPEPPKSVLGDDITVPERLDPVKTALADNDGDDGDIFKDAGTDYDPLGSEQDTDEADEDVSARLRQQLQDAGRPPTQISKRNYFNDTQNPNEQARDHLAGVRAIIEKAAKLSQKDEPAAEDDADVARRAKHAAMLANRDRDLDDIDMGFGASRYEDGEDAEGDTQKVRLSEWRDGGADRDDDDKPERHHDKKKRKPKKRKGDANNIADIMGVIERRKEKK